MTTTKTTLLLLVQVEQTETPEPPRPVIETTGAIVCARPIRAIRTTDSSARLAGTLDGLVRWIGRAS